MRITSHKSRGGRNAVRVATCALVCLLTIPAAAAAQEPSKPQPPPPAPATQNAAPPNIERWEDDFSGTALDETKWERYSIEGASSKVAVRDGQLQLRGAGGSRAGVRSKNTFNADRFAVEATIGKVGERYPESGSAGAPPGNAIIAVLFGGRADRLEWVMTSEGRFEAWLMRDDRSERLDSKNLGTREKTPRLSIARRGDEVYFMLNGQIGLQKTIKALPNNFRVMLYGFGSSENNWDAVVVQTLKQ